MLISTFRNCPPSLPRVQVLHHPDEFPAPGPLLCCPPCLADYVLGAKRRAAYRI